MKTKLKEYLVDLLELRSILGTLDQLDYSFGSWAYKEYQYGDKDLAQRGFNVVGDLFESIMREIDQILFDVEDKMLEEEEKLMEKEQIRNIFEELDLYVISWELKKMCESLEVIIQIVEPYDYEVKDRLMQASMDLSSARQKILERRRGREEKPLTEESKENTKT